MKNCKFHFEKVLVTVTTTFKSGGDKSLASHTKLHLWPGPLIFSLADAVLCMVPTVMESHEILASHGKSWKMERVMEKSWNFNHLFSEKNS